MKTNTNFLINMLLLILTLMTLGCGQGTKDQFINLGGGYVYSGRGKAYNYILKRTKVDITKNIYADVVDFAFDSAFVVVKQKPIKDSSRGLIATFLNNGREDFNVLLVKADSILENDPYYVKIYSQPVNYWIIDKENDVLHGPMSENEFEQKKKLLKVSKELTF